MTGLRKRFPIATIRLQKSRPGLTNIVDNGVLQALVNGHFS